MRRTQKQLSPKQLAANRANSANSTGPKTPEGKARSAQNSVKHGFTASTFAVVRLEDLQEIALLKSDLVSVYQPVNSQELFALERMALAQQSILRAARLESGLFTTCLNETLAANDHPFTPMNEELAGDGDIEVTRAQNRNYLLAEGFLRTVRQSNGWTIFLRYQAQAERLYRRALEDFDRLKALRPELPNEAIPDLQPQPESATYPTSETNPPPLENVPPAPAPDPDADPSAGVPRPCPPPRQIPSSPRPRPRHSPAAFTRRRSAGGRCSPSLPCRPDRKLAATPGFNLAPSQAHLRRFGNV
jgi:hypothetical protein